jgi:inosose dehydratase
MQSDRRGFLKGMLGAGLGSIFLSYSRLPSSTRFPISGSSYDWVTFYRREGKTWWENPERKKKRGYKK